MESLTAAEVVGRTLAALGVRDAFGVLGSGNFIATQALHAAGAAFHHARHENGAICMADGYARVSGRVGVCSVHQGPGFTNAMTGLTEAAKSRTPLLLLAGEAPAAALRSNFRLDQAALATTVGAAAERVHSGASAADDVARALRRAQVERRPVLLSMPLDVQAQPAPARRAAAARARAARARPVAGRRRRGRRADRRRAGGRSSSPAAARSSSGARRGARGARRRHRRRARHLRDGPRALRRVAVGGGDLRRLRLAGRRPADRGVRPRAGLRRLADPLDDARRRADRPGRQGRPGRRRPGGARRAPAGRRRRGRRRRRDGAGAARRGRAGHRRPRRRAGRRDRRRLVARRRLRGRRRGRPHGPADALDRPRRAAAAGAHRRGRLGSLHGLPADVPARPRSGRLRVHAGVPVDRPRPGQRHRRRRSRGRTASPSPASATAAR